MDIADRADSESEAFLRAARQRAANQIFAKGEPGECIWCGEESPRLVNNACASCRDRRRLA
jgi:hypothetical protein